VHHDPIEPADQVFEALKHAQREMVGLNEQLRATVTAARLELERCRSELRDAIDSSQVRGSRERPRVEGRRDRSYKGRSALVRYRYSKRPHSPEQTKSSQRSAWRADTPP
jgi:hypothetical protein